MHRGGLARHAKALGTSALALAAVTGVVYLVRPVAPDITLGVLYVFAILLRNITADPSAVAVVVMPELVVRGTDRLLHNQRALYLKRLLLFEPRVILASVPYQLT